MYISCLKREEIWMSDPHVFVPHKNIRVLFTLGIGFFFKYREAKLNFQLCFRVWPIMNLNCETYFSTKHAAIKILQELRVLSRSIQLLEYQMDLQRCRFDNI